MAERSYFYLYPKPADAAYWGGFYKNFNRKTVFRLTQTKETKALFFYKEDEKMYEYFTGTCFEPYTYTRVHKGARTKVDSWAVPGCEPAFLPKLTPVSEEEFKAEVAKFEDVAELFSSLISLNIEKGRRTRNIQLAEKQRRDEERAEQKAAEEAAKKAEEERLAHEAAIEAGEIPPDPVTVEDVASEAVEMLRYTVAAAKDSL